MKYVYESRRTSCATIGEAGYNGYIYEGIDDRKLFDYDKGNGGCSNNIEGEWKFC